METQDSEIRSGDRLDSLAIVDMTVEGQSVARHEGRVVFLDSGLPGAIVSAEVTRRTKGVLHARVTHVERPSPHEITPWCPHFGECGACMWQHFAPRAALDWKQEHVRQCLARIGKIASLPVLPVLATPVEKHFRNKMTFAFVGEIDGTVRLGLRLPKNHTVAEVQHCALQDPVGMEILAFVREEVSRLGLRAFPAVRERGAGRDKEGQGGYLRFLVIRTPLMRDEDGTRQTHVECISGLDHGARAGCGKNNADAVEALGQSLVRRFGCAFAHSERKDIADVAQGEKTVGLIGADSYQESFGSLVLSVPYNAFLQTNTRVASQLYAQVVNEAELRPEDVLWDIYCGIGAIGLYAGNGVGRVHGFELQKNAVEAARANARALGFSHATFHAGDVSQTLAEPGLQQPDVIVADPPRAGLSEGVRQYLLHTPARRFLYISCNVATQARDAALLSDCWKAVKSVPFDMFPYTPHVENLLVFTRR